MNGLVMFRFEEDFAESLRCIPMSVRLKLDLCGIKLTLRQWSRLTPIERQWLAGYPCATEAAALDLRCALAGLIGSRTTEAVRYLEIDRQPAWTDVGAVPTSIVTKARDVGVSPPSRRQWQSLTPLQRFALLKLTREGHESANFLPALREFGLLDDLAFADG